MNNTTCGECKHYNKELAFCHKCGARWIRGIYEASCEYFEQKYPPINNDKIDLIIRLTKALHDDLRGLLNNRILCRISGIYATAKEIKIEKSVCHRFEKLTPPTNGDKIIAGGNKALAKFRLSKTCNICIYCNKKHASYNDICICPRDKCCTDGIEAWLNTPAESEGEDE
jgi:hypothetical protein